MTFLHFLHKIYLNVKNLEVSVKEAEKNLVEGINDFKNQAKNLKVEHGKKKEGGDLPAAACVRGPPLPFLMFDAPLAIG